jgi:hypothetical protein
MAASMNCDGSERDLSSGICFCLSLCVLIESALLESVAYAGQHSIEIAEHFFIPESDDLKSMGFQSRRARSIFFFSLIRMLSAVHFYDQSMPQTAEVDDVIADCMLTAELRAVQAFGAKVLPEEAFGWSLLATETATVGTQLFRCTHNRQLYCKI